MKTSLYRINPKNLQEEFARLGVDRSGSEIMSKKARDFVFFCNALPLSAMHTLKQEALSVGADLATPQDAILCKKSHYDAILLGSFSQIKRISQKCLSQPFGLKSLALHLSTHLSSKASSSPKIMAILNLTPDSFYQGSRFDCTDALRQIEQYIQMGVEMIDIGGASSRPGSEILGYEEELQRLQPLLDEIAERGLGERAIFSIDTYNYQTADYALSRGFKILNDILGFSDERLLEVCAKHNASAVLMHSRGTPQTMQNLTEYECLMSEVDEFFESGIERMKSYGVSEIVLDIGFGFAKLRGQNLSLIKNLSHFKRFNLPILVGASRKSTIGEILDKKTADDRLYGTLALHQIALQNGAEILRVHDVAPHQDMIKIFKAM